MNSLLSNLLEIYSEIKTANKGNNAMNTFFLHKDKNFDYSEISAKLLEMKQLMEGEACTSKSQDDFYLGRFLYARLYNVSAAVALVSKYETFHRNEPGWMTIQWNDIDTLVSSEVLTVLEKKHQGKRVLWMRPGLWDPEMLPPEAALRAGAIAVEPLSAEQDTQKFGVIIIVDLKSIGVTQLKALNKIFIKKLIHYIAHCTPIWIDSVHLVNIPALFSIVLMIFFSLFKEKLRDKIQMHGRGFKGLRNQISPEVLPTQLGGTQSPNPRVWLNWLKSPINLRVFADLGYDARSKFRTKDCEIEFPKISD